MKTAVLADITKRGFCMSYEFCGRIRYSEMDETGKLSLGGLVNYFQDVSTFQSESLGVGVDYMKERRLAWVLSSWQIVIDRYPRLGEAVTAQTWPYEFNAFMGMRNFALLDSERNYLARANSIWAMIDIDKQRPVRCPEEILEKYPLEAPLDMDYAPRKVLVPADGEKKPAFPIGKQMLDTNHHVNNGQYITLAGTYLPESFPVRQIRAEYKKQARLHDVMQPIVSCQEGKVIVALCDEAGRPYAVVEFLKG